MQTCLKLFYKITESISILVYKLNYVLIRNILNKNKSKYF